jgi:hypothetical protein
MKWIIEQSGSDDEPEVEAATRLARIAARGIVTIDGIRFVGAALRFPDTPDKILCRGPMNDFRLIADSVP